MARELFNRKPNELSKIPLPQSYGKLSLCPNRLPLQSIDIQNQYAPPQNGNVGVVKAKQLIRKSLVIGRGQQLGNGKFPISNKRTNIETSVINPKKTRPNAMAINNSKPADKGPKTKTFTKNTLMTSSDKIKHLELENSKLQTFSNEKQILVTQYEIKIREHETTLKKLDTLLKNENTSSKCLKERLDECTEKIINLTQTNNELFASVQKLERECKECTLTNDILNSRLTQLQKIYDDLLQLKMQIEQKYNEKLFANENMASKITLLNSKNNSLLEKNCLLSTQLTQAELQRKALHNQIMDLKGNIRVFCRIRPFLKEELLENNCDNYYIHTSSEDDYVVELLKKEIASQKPLGVVYKFKFDKVFDHTSTQKDVYDEVSGVIQSALDGFNVCVFAYGATGSGKTFTMEGNMSENREHIESEDEMSSEDSSENDTAFITNSNMGVIPRAFQHIFNHLKYVEEMENMARLNTKEGNVQDLKTIKYELTASYIEIYNEKIRDLLFVPKLNTNTKGAVPTAIQPDYEIKMTDVTGDELTIVPEVTKIIVTEWKHVETILKRASKNRAVAKTKLNLSSSRSHSVFQLKIERREVCGKTSKTLSSSTLSLVDLAGSERIKQSGSTSGDRLAEAKYINTSLSTLSTVVTCLAKRELSGKSKKATASISASKDDIHVPYRNSKLTYLLKSSLGAGNSKTLMFVNVNPLESRMEETLCSLRFAAKVNSCHIGSATVSK